MSKPTPQEQHVSAEWIRQKVDTMYAAMGQIGQSMKQASYTAGAMEAANFVKVIEDAARYDGYEERHIERPPQKLDMHTLAFVIKLMKAQTQKSVDSLCIVDVEIEKTQDRPPPGTRLS